MNRIKAFKTHTVKSSNIKLIVVPEERQKEWAKTIFEKTGSRIF